jgi:hypothetical protein
VHDQLQLAEVTSREGLCGLPLVHPLLPAGLGYRGHLPLTPCTSVPWGLVGLVCRGSIGGTFCWILVSSGPP